MQLADYLDFLGPDVIRLKGHRIGLEHIVERYRLGQSPEQMALDLPGVPLEMLYGVIAYYLHHQAEVDAYVERVEAYAEQLYQEHIQRHPERLIEQLRQRLAARHEQTPL
ncbi:MAG: DUF433 domain-containing protein [Blastochloris sp.]|nr:DUF433 domain-containing protein [Blastochloris sp.]